jgi:hypothetical protein
VGAPPFKEKLDRVMNSVSCISAAVPLHEQPVVLRMPMTNCRYNGSIESFLFKRPSCRAASDSAAAAA